MEQIKYMLTDLLQTLFVISVFVAIGFMIVNIFKKITLLKSTPPEFDFKSLDRGDKIRVIYGEKSYNVFVLENKKDTGEVEFITINGHYIGTVEYNNIIRIL